MSSGLSLAIALASKPPAVPVTFGGCFGWVHQVTDAPASDTAVLLCAGLSRDASTGHRSFLALATRLAASGYPALRFDYPGTGDSCEAGTPECWGAWLHSIQQAADWLRAATGARRIVMMGLRLGATLAALAGAERDDIAGLVLLQPVPRGRSYVGQLQVEARIRRQGGAAPDDGIEVDGLNLSGETLRIISQVDLRQARLRLNGPVAVFNQAPSAILDACVTAWRNQGIVVTTHDFAGLDAFLRPSHLADEPPADVAAVLSWLETAIATRPRSDVPAISLADRTVVRPNGCTETPLRFGAHGHLFGMLCHPESDRFCDHIVIIGNTGGDPHHGFARFSVELARRMAAAGIASLRMDFAGLGDSLSPSGDADSPTHVFEINRSPDMTAAIDRLQAMGYRRFTASGLCSGAYHALQVALVDERIGSLLLINLPWFTLRHDKVGPSSIARRSMTSLSRRLVSTLLLFAEGDAGLLGLEKHFGPGGSELAASPGAIVSIVTGLDHNLTGSAMRQFAAEHMIDFLHRHPTIDAVAEHAASHSLAS